MNLNKLAPFFLFLAFVLVPSAVLAGPYARSAEPVTVSSFEGFIFFSYFSQNLASASIHKCAPYHAGKPLKEVEVDIDAYVGGSVEVYNNSEVPQDDCFQTSLQGSMSLSVPKAGLLASATYVDDEFDVSQTVEPGEYHRHQTWSIRGVINARFQGSEMMHLSSDDPDEQVFISLREFLELKDTELNPSCQVTDWDPSTGVGFTWLRCHYEPSAPAR